MRTEKFKLSEVFNWQSQKEIDPLKINLLTVEGCYKYPFYGQSTVNNGIISFLTLKPDVLNNKAGNPTILIHSNNQNIVYLETPFYLKDGHGATSVLQSDMLNEKNALYMIACIKKVITKKFAYNDKATKIALKNTYIELPVKNDGTIDYEYMESYVNSAENNLMNHLFSDLKRCGLDKCDLSQSEKDIFYRFESGNLKYSCFKITDIFEVKNTNSIVKKDIVLNSGDIPYVTAGEGNNSILGYTTFKNQLIEEGNSIMIGGKTLVITYQPRDYYSNDSHNLALYIKDCKGRTEKAQLFMVAALYKSLKSLYTWGDSISKRKIQNNEVFLPVNADGEIDFEIMEAYVKIQEKIAIKDVMEWRSRKDG